MGGEKARREPCHTLPEADARRDLSLLPRELLEEREKRSAGGLHPKTNWSAEHDRMAWVLLKTVSLWEENNKEDLFNRGGTDRQKDHSLRVFIYPYEKRVFVELTRGGDDE